MKSKSYDFMARISGSALPPVEHKSDRELIIATKTLKNQITGSIAIPKKNESSIFCGFNEPKIIGIGPVFQKL